MNVYLHVDRQVGARLNEQAAKSLSLSVCSSTGVLNACENENLMLNVHDEERIREVRFSIRNPSCIRLTGRH